MIDSKTISRNKPKQNSANYALLREKGLEHIANLSGAVWTDHNTHDPGITFLEVLSYVLASECGFKMTFPMEDLLATHNGSGNESGSWPGQTDFIKNFFSARRILHTCPVTTDDFRKLIMDTQLNIDGSLFGFNNTFLLNSNSEIPIYFNSLNGELEYERSSSDTLPLNLKCLNNVLLELGFSTLFGDLNDQVFQFHLPNDLSTEFIPVSGLEDFEIMIVIRFPNWDQAEVDWNKHESILKNIIDIEFKIKPDTISVTYAIDNTGRLKISSDGSVNIVDLESLLNGVLFDDEDGPLKRYQRKVLGILTIKDVVGQKLISHRNLCEDFLDIMGFKVDRIAVCADIIAENDSIIEDTQAKIYYEISKFFAPYLNLQSLAQLQAKPERIESIFDGPPLDNGFIESKQLKTQTRKTIHVSDLINIVMKIDGVKAVRDIKIASIPQDNTDNLFIKNARWCLELNLEQGYLPRFSQNDSKITFIKDGLTFRADNVKVNEKLFDLQSRNEITRYQNNDIPFPNGRFRSPGQYTSLQNDLPFIYGVGDKGLPPDINVSREVSAKQLKAYLSLFDQLIANFMAQLAHIKDIFSFSKDIKRTYFTQPLFNIVPNIIDWGIYRTITAIDDEPNKTLRAEALDEMVESKELFLNRRNAFLDHVLSRFAEQFDDYALLLQSIHGIRSKEDLIEDKINFLQEYPELSACRGRGFNYKDRYKIWHIDNVSGLEKRASRLLGIENRPSNWLSFGSGLSILATGFEFQDTNVTLKSVDTFNSYKEVYSAVENMILSGVFLSNYETESGGQIRVKCNGKYIAESERTDYSDEESKQGINTLITSFRDELLKNQRSNRKNLAININEYIVKPALNDIELTTEGTYPKFMFSFIIAIDDHEIIKGDFEGCISELSMDEGLNEDELKLMALEHVFWTTLFYARDENNYRLVENSGDYVYEILDRCKNVVGTSVDKDFSQDLAMSLSDAEIKIADSISNDGQYSVLGNPTATKSNIEVTIDGSLDEGDITGVMEVEHTVPINYIEDDVIYLAEYRPFINEDFNISISTNDQNVNKKVNKTGTGVDCNTQLFMESSLQTEYPPDGTNSIGTIKYNESFPIVGIEGNKITARTKEGLRSIRKNVCLVNNHFFGNEGLHLIEHILLRPKIYHPYLPFKKEGIDNDKLDLIVNPKGDIYFQKQVKILELDQNQNMIIVSGDLTSELGTAFDSENQIQIERSSGYNGVYKLREVTFANNQTLIKVIGQLPRVQHIIREFGVISYYKQALGVSFLDDGQKIEIEDPDFEPKTEKVELRIRDSLNNVNDGDFIATVEKNDTKWRAKLMEKRSEIEDRLLPVSKSDCHACTIEDPYSFMATVVVPYWQGRFDTPGFREFVEKTIRTEAPAHIHLNICWIDNRQMIMFEKAYKEWLLELAKEESDPEELSAALNNFIGVIEQLRNVYPSGRLHNCEDGDQIRNSIILDNTSIGTL